MSENKQSASSILKQPFTMAIILVAIAIVIIWANQKSSENASTVDTKVDSEQSGNAPGAALPLKPSTAAMPGSDTPRIVANMNQQQKPAGSVAAPGLENLLKGLEAKVAADPGNINNRILLAQTYNELGMQDKALTEMRALQKEDPDNGRVNLILGSILSQSNDQEKLKESLPLLEKASGDKTIQQYLVNMYKGDALIRMQDHAGALEQWKLALEGMPLADNRRAKLEQRINELSKNDKNKKQDQPNAG